jgi:hypothetical protein
MRVSRIAAITVMGAAAFGVSATAAHADYGKSGQGESSWSHKSSKSESWSDKSGKSESWSDKSGKSESWSHKSGKSESWSHKSSMPWSSKKKPGEIEVAPAAVKAGHKVKFSTEDCHKCGPVKVHVDIDGKRYWVKLAKWTPEGKTGWFKVPKDTDPGKYKVEGHCKWGRPIEGSFTVKKDHKWHHEMKHHHHDKCHHHEHEDKH